MDPAHLSARLGLFVLIVLGESVVQVVQAASGAQYGLRLLGAALVCFLVLAGMFVLSVVYGHAGLPHLRPNRLPPRGEFVLHALVTGTIATIAVALAAGVAGADEPFADDQRWLLCAAVAAYFALGLIAFWAGNGFRPGVTLAWVVTGIGGPLLLGPLADDVRASGIVSCTAVLMAAHVWMERRAGEHQQ